VCRTNCHQRQGLGEVPEVRDSSALVKDMKYHRKLKDQFLFVCRYLRQTNVRCWRICQADVVLIVRGLGSRASNKVL